MPKSNRDYWNAKITRNRERDQLNLTKLEALGWEAWIVWECQINSLQVQGVLVAFLESFGRRDGRQVALRPRD